MSSRVEELFFSHRGNQIDKWEQYLPIYDIELARFAQAGQPVSLLEIGVQNGGSLELWNSLLPKDSIIRGVDIDPRVAQIAFSSSNIRVDVIDGTSDEMVELFSDQSFDVIIDDGSHISKDIISTFRKCFQLVRPGGIYIIEDLHAAYYASLGGGLFQPDSAVSFLRTLIDALHADYITQDEANVGADLELFKRYNRLIGRITFYDSVAVIEKLKRPKAEPYRRILSGTTSMAVHGKQWLDALPRRQLASLCLSPQAAEQVDHRLVNKIEQLEEDCAALSRQRDLALAQLGSMRDELASKEARVAALEATSEEYHVLLDRERGLNLGYHEQLKTANEMAEGIRRDLERERANNHQIIEEFRGKLGRSYAAWRSQVIAIKRLKTGRRP